MLYVDLVTALQGLLTIQPGNADFTAILPRCIDYAEQRLYRDLNLEANSTRLSVTSAPPIPLLTPGNRNLVLTAGTFVIVEDVNIISAGAASPDAGTRMQLVRVSWNVLDALFGAAAPAGPPRYFALQDAATLAFGPWPDQAYPVEILGVIRPAPLAAANTSTTLSLFFPDLLVAACMIFMAGYQRDFGQQSDDPALAQSWSTQYDKLLASAQAEEARKRGSA